MRWSGLGAVRSAGLLWGNEEVLGSELGCERIGARRWHEKLIEFAQSEAVEAPENAEAWFEENVRPWIRRSRVSASHVPTAASWLRYLNDLGLETAAYVSFLQAGSQVFTVSRWVQEDASFLDADRPLLLPQTLPYPSFFLALDRHAAFTVWDEVRPGEAVDGCFVRRQLGGGLELYFTLRGEQASTGLPGVGVTLAPAAVAAHRTVRGVVEASLLEHQPTPAQPALPEDPLRRRQLEGHLSQAAEAIELQTAGRMAAIVYAVNRMLKLLAKLAELPRQDSLPAWALPRTAAERKKREAQEVRFAPNHPRVVELSLTSVPGAPQGFGHYRAKHAAPLPHWRRAHWRDQPCGPGRAERRRVLIEPTRVGMPGVVGPREYAVRP